MKAQAIKAAASPALELTEAMRLDDQQTDELATGQQLKNGAYTITALRPATQGSFNYDAETKDGTPVTVREFYLTDMCERDGNTVCFNNNADKALYRKLVKGFVNDANYLLSLENPNIAVVSDVFEENRTAYMISQPPAGRNLEEILATTEAPFKPFEIARMASHLFTGLIDIHAFGMLHRDINPKNIVITDKGRAILMADFGTFREDKSRVSKVVSSVMCARKEHAPLEFIFQGSEQNEASDVFSLASVIYQLITGSPPVGCQTRLARVAADEPDPYVPLSGQYNRFDPRFLSSIDSSLELLNEKRIRSATEFLECFVRKNEEDKFLKQRESAMKRRPRKVGFVSSLFKMFRA